MGLNKPIPAGGIFLRILDGNIVQKSKTERPGWELYKTENPSTKTPVQYWIERYDSIDGYLVKIDRVEKPDDNVYGWKLYLLDDFEYLLDLKDGSPTTRRVLAMLPNVQLNKMLTIKVFKDKEGYNAILFQQDGQNVPQHWNKETLPEPRKIGGKWNYAEAEALVYDETLKLAVDTNAQGVDALEHYREGVRHAVGTGSYTGPQKPQDEYAPEPTDEDVPEYVQAAQEARGER